MFKRIFLIFVLGIAWEIQAQTIKIGDTIPTFKTTTYNGEEFSIDSTLEHTTIFLFWATWNVPSLQLMEEIKEQYQFVNPVKRGVKQINIDVIDFCIDANKELYLASLKRENLPWPIHFNDYKGWESDLMNMLNIRKIPTMLIVNVKRQIIIIDVETKQLRNVLSNLILNLPLSN
jgi:thiol-disulfide isomerase/thioredoxin